METKKILKNKKTKKNKKKVDLRKLIFLQSFKKDITL